jgi:hypothetical protein
MSAVTATSAGASLPATSLPPINPALEPASIRTGDKAAKNAYQTGLAFEDILVGQLTQAMTATVPGLDGSSSGGDGLGGSSDDGLGGSTASGDGSSSGGLGAYSSLLPDTLTSTLMSAGGTGVAMQIAQGIDPALRGKS